MATFADLVNQGISKTPGIGINTYGNTYNGGWGYNSGGIGNTNLGLNANVSNPTVSSAATPTSTNTGSGWGDYLSGAGSLITGLASAYTGFQNIGLANKSLGLAKKQFNFQKDLANRNLANQAKTINNAYNNAAQVAGGMIGSVDAQGNYGATSQAIMDQYAAKAKEQHVDGSAL